MITHSLILIWLMRCWFWRRCNSILLLNMIGKPRGNWNFYLVNHRSGVPLLLRNFYNAEKFKETPTCIVWVFIFYWFTSHSRIMKHATYISHSCKSTDYPQLIKYRLAIYHCVLSTSKVARNVTAAKHLV